MSVRERIILAGEEGLAEALRSALSEQFELAQSEEMPSTFANCSCLLVAQERLLQLNTVPMSISFPIIALATDQTAARHPRVYRTLNLDSQPIGHLAEEIRFTIRAHEIERYNVLLKQVVENSSDCILAVDGDSSIMLANNAVTWTFGYEPADLLSCRISTLFEPGSGRGYSGEMLDALKSGGLWSGEIVGRRRDGSTFPVHVSLTFARDEQLGANVAILHARDVTDQQRLLERLKQLSITDDLTGAFNVRYLWARLRYEFLRARRYSQPMSVLMGDLDRFKTVNDTYGHRAGDEVLRLVTKTMQENIRQVDIVARYGGEEFAVILPNTSIQGALECAEHIRKAVQEAEMQIGGQILKITISIGAAQLSADVADEEALIRRADDALIHAKRSGRNRVCPWAPGLLAEGESSKKSRPK